MVIKNALPRAPVVLSAEEYRRVVQIVGILAEVDQRASVRCVDSQHVSAKKRKQSKKKDTGLKNQIIRKVRNFYGPCFFVQTILNLCRKRTKILKVCFYLFDIYGFNVIFLVLFVWFVLIFNF